MMEVFLYACDVCDTVKMSRKDNGSVWCVMCQACKECQFFNKISIEQKYTMGKWVSVFDIEGDKDDGNKKE